MASLNDLVYAFFGGEPGSSLSDVEYAHLRAFFEAGFTVQDLLDMAVAWDNGGRIDPIEVGSGDALWPQPIAANDYLLLSGFTGVGYSSITPSTTTSNSNNLAIYVRFPVVKRIGVCGLACHLTTANAGASAVMRLGIYSDSNGKPGTVVKDAGTASANTAALKDMSFTEIFLDPGHYHAVVALQNLDTGGTNPAISCANVGTSAPDSAPVGTTAPFMYPVSQSISGAFANNPTIVQVRTSPPKIPNIWMKVSTP